MHATTPNGNMGFDQYTVPDDCSCMSNILLLFSLSTRKLMSMASRAILSNFFEEQ